MTMRFLAALPLALFLTACASGPAPKDNFYRLQAAPPQQAMAQPKLKGRLEVQRFLADGVMGQRPLAWSEAAKPHLVQQYSYHLWTDAPGTLLQGQTIAYLKAANAAENIVAPELRLNPDYVMSGKLVRLERVIGSRPKAVIEIDVALRHAPTDRLILARNYQALVEATDDSLDATLIAFNAGLSDILARLTADVGK